MGDQFSTGRALTRYPLVGNGVQAGIMAHVHAEARPVSRAQLTAALKVTRGKVSAEVAELIEAGFLAEEGLARFNMGSSAAMSTILTLCLLLISLGLYALTRDRSAQ